MNNNTISIERIHPYLALRREGPYTTHILTSDPFRTIWTVRRVEGPRVSMHYTYKDAVESLDSTAVAR